MVTEIDAMKLVDLPPTVGIVERNSIDYIQAVFSALGDGHVVVPLRSEDDDARITAAQVEEVAIPDENSGWCQPQLSLVSSETIAHISFTSGTEGAPKGVLLSARALNDTVQRVQSVMQMDHSVKEYIGVPVYHSFGYGRCRHVAAVEGQFYIPAAGFNPQELAQMLAAGEVNALSLVPSLLRVLLQSPTLLGESALQLKWLEIGSQPMTADEKKQVRQLFPNARIVQHYGLTEASRTTLLQIDGADDELLDSVGCVYGDGELVINDAGRICIKGAHLASQIIKGAEFVPVSNSEGWFETSDLGRIDAGYLYFLGRADNMVNCGGQKLSTEVLEQAILSELNERSENVGELAVSRIANALYGEGFLVSITNENAIDEVPSIAETCLQALGISAKNALRYQYVASLPKTATGKVQHKQLAERAEKSQKNTNSHQESITSDNGCKPPIEASFAQILGLPIDRLDMSESVSDIGVDSLQSVQLLIHLENHLGYLPPQWLVKPMGELFDLPKSAASPTNIDASSEASAPQTASKQKAPPLWDGSSNRNPEGMSFWSLVKEDFVTHDRDFFSQGLFALFVHRFGNWRMGIKTKLLRFPMTLLYRGLIKLVQMFCGIKLDYTVQVGRRVKLEHFGGMILGARSIGDDTIIRQNTTFGIRDMSDLAAKPMIEQGVNIGAGAVIVGNITVGRHSIIGPNCVITEDIPPFSFVSVGSMVVTRPEIHSEAHCDVHPDVHPENSAP